MGISMSGIGETQKVGVISISVSEDHPLVLLSGSLDWVSMSKLVEADIVKTSRFWMKGRAIQIRTHLGVYLLQKLYDYTDRKTEYQVNDNAAAQVFCGALVVEGWNAPDHTRIENFRNRLFHAKQLACISKGKVGKALDFGRVFQLARINGNFIFAIECSSVRMNDKASFSELIAEHERLFGLGSLETVAADKGYFTKRNRRLLDAKNVPQVGLQKPGKALEEDSPQKTLLYIRRAGIEPLIGHVKQGGQLGKSRMKSDAATLAAGYGSILSFNLRPFIRHKQRKYSKAA